MKAAAFTRNGVETVYAIMKKHLGPVQLDAMLSELQEEHELAYPVSIGAVKFRHESEMRELEELAEQDPPSMPPTRPEGGRWK